MFLDENPTSQMMRFNDSKMELYANKSMSMKEKILAAKILNLQNSLSGSMIMPIEPLLSLPLIRTTVPEDFHNVAMVLINDSEINLEGAYIALSGIISCALWGRVIVRVKDVWYEPAIDYVIQYAESGMRKTAFINKLINPIQNFENTLIDSHDFSLSSVKGDYFNSLEREIIKRSIYKQLDEPEIDLNKSIKEWDFIADKIRDIENIKRKIRNDKAQLICKGGTLKGIERRMLIHGGTQALLSSDSNFVVKLFSEQSDLLLQAHTQETYNREKYPRGINIPNPALPMVLFTQPDIAQKLYRNEKIINNGLLNRVVPYFHTNKLFKVNNIIDDAAFLLFVDKIDSLLSRFFTSLDNENRLELRLNDYALNILFEFEAYISGITKECEYGKGWFSKLHGQALRFAADIHCWNNPSDPGENSISDVEMRQGIYLAKCAIPHALFAFSPDGLCAMYDAKKILSNFYRISDPFVRNDLLIHGTTSLEISRRIGISHARVKAGLNYLAKRNYLIAFDDWTPYVRVALHPQIFNAKCF